MADTREPPSSDVTFRGTDGNECEAFVVAIRELAYEKGKDKDDDWMLRYATTRLRGRALRWHAKLDPSIRKDWDLLVQAMFEEYPLVEERDEGGIATPVWTSTTFSPASSTTTLPGNDCPHALLSTLRPSGMVQPQSSGPLGCVPIPAPRVYGPSLPGLQVGRLRIVHQEGETGPLYVWWGPRHDSCYARVDLKSFTTNIHEALIVTFMPSSEPHQIGCVNSRKPGTWNLGVQLFASESSEFHPLAGTLGPAVPQSRTTYNDYDWDYQIISNIWNVLNDGTLRATLADLSTYSVSNGGWVQTLHESFSTATVYVEIPGATLSFVKEYVTPQTLHPNSGRPIVRARIVFEPI